MHIDFWLEEEKSVYLKYVFKAFLYNNSHVIKQHSKSRILSLAQPPNFQF